MRKYALILPILALSACSVIEQPFIESQSNMGYGQYDQGCSAGSCAPGQSYSVAGAQNGHHSGLSHTGGDFNGEANANHWPDTNLIPAYESGGPVHVNPNGYGHNGNNVYGGQQGYGYGQPPHLRGMYGQKRGNFYGTLGGVMYDTDVDSFGVQGRVGYDSGRGFLGASYGAEVEGSLGVTSEDLSDEVGLSQLDSKFDNNLGAYLVVRRPLTQRLSLHGRVGYNSNRFSVEAVDVDGDSVKEKATLDGLSIGLGGEYAISPTTGLRIDYTETDTDFGGAMKGWAASVTRKF